MIPEVYIPFEGEHLWKWYWENLCKFGEGRLTFQEVQSWIQLLGIFIYPWEITILMKMDSAFQDSLEQIRERSREGDKP